MAETSFPLPCPDVSVSKKALNASQNGSESVVPAANVVRATKGGGAWRSSTVCCVASWIDGSGRTRRPVAASRRTCRSACIDGQGKPWRIPVNVRSGDPAKSLVIFHRADPLLSHPILENLAAVSSGLTDLNRKPRSASNALDYSRAPLFDWPTGIALPPTGPGEDDDLQDVVSRQLNNLKASGGELFAFGSHFHDRAPKAGIDTEFGTKDGMHDIHMNQGNAPHEHDEDNGVFNDGGLDSPVPGPRHGAVLPLQDPVPADRRQGPSHPRRVEGDSAGQRADRADSARAAADVCRPSTSSGLS